MMNIMVMEVKDHICMQVIRVLWLYQLNGFYMRYCIPILLFLAFSCSPSVSVFNDYDRQIDLSSYSSYNWKQLDRKESVQNPLYDNELNDKRIKTAVDKAMKKKGYQIITESPELYVHYHIVIEDKSVVIRESDIHNYSTYWLGLDMNAYQYKEGSLIIDLMDAKTDALVWRGWAVTILEDLNPENVEKRLDRTIQRIFEGLPASAGN
jgi:Domain of unknown function (DUF4136)